MSDFSNPGWIGKFKNAFSGIAKGVRGQNSFMVHIPMAMAVIALAILFQLDWLRISILLLCIAVVLAAEIINSAFERVAKSITSDFDQNIGDALDIASGAVLVASIFSAVVGAIILLPPILSWFFA